MKTIPNNPITFRQALEANVRKATARVALSRNSVKELKPKKKKVPRTLLIESQIQSIITQIRLAASKEVTVIREAPAKGSSCAAVVRVYDSGALAEFEKKKKEYSRLLNEGYSASMLEKPEEIIPIEKYAFYPHTTDAMRLGSVAIYGGNAVLRLLKLRRESSFFGHRMLSADIEMGRRPFVDVKLGSPLQ